MIQNDCELLMPEERWEEFNELLDRPGKPIAALAELFAGPTVFSD